MSTPYENLANAIVLQAVIDYRNTNSLDEQADIERFFRSKWFSILTSIDCETLIVNLRKEMVANEQLCV